MTEIVGTLFCEQKVVLDLRFGKRMSREVAAKAAAGSAAHRQFELEGYLRRPTRLLAKAAARPASARDRRCFIATQVYGPTARETEVLRAWRDRALMPRRLGRWAVALYYFTSPALVQLLQRSRIVSRLVHTALNRIVRLVERNR